MAGRPSTRLDGTFAPQIPSLRYSNWVAKRSSLKGGALEAIKGGYLQKYDDGKQI